MMNESCYARREEGMNTFSFSARMLGMFSCLNKSAIICCLLSGDEGYLFYRVNDPGTTQE
jgi:hypothetical protein